MLEAPPAQKLTHGLKAQLAALSLPSRGCGGARLRPVALSGRLVDVCIAAWLVMPDSPAVSDSPSPAGSKVRAPANRMLGTLSASFSGYCTDPTMWRNPA